MIELNKEKEFDLMNFCRIICFTIGLLLIGFGFALLTIFRNYTIYTDIGMITFFCGLGLMLLIMFLDSEDN